MAPQKFTSAYDSGFATGHDIVQGAISKVQEGLFYAKDSTVKGIEAYQAVKANPGKYADQAMACGKDVLSHPVQSVSTAASKLVYLYIGILNSVLQPILGYVQPLQEKVFAQSKAVVEETKRKGNQAVEVYDSQVVPGIYKVTGAAAGIAIGLFSLSMQVVNSSLAFTQKKLGLNTKSQGIASR